MCTCRLMSSRAPNAPPTPPSDEPHALLGQAEAGGDLLAVLVQPLRGDVQLDAAAVVVGDGQRRLEAEERLVLHADLVRALDDDVARRRRRRRSAIRWWRRTLPSGWIGGWRRRSPPPGRAAARAPRTRRRSRRAPGGTSRGGRRRRRRPARRRSARTSLANTGWSAADQPVRRRAGHVVGGEHRLDAGDLPAPATRRSTRCARTDAASAAWRPTAAPSTGRSDENAKRALHLGDAVGRGPASRRSARPATAIGARASVIGHCARPPRATATCCTASMIRP